jgi:predicted acyltransferase
VSGAWVLAINKPIWTSSYVLYTSGLAFLALAGCHLIVDRWRLRRWGLPFLVLGTNPILAYMLAGMHAHLMRDVRVGGRSLHAAVHESVFAPLVPDRAFASLLFAVCFTLLWTGAMAICYRRGWFLKV